MVHHSDGSIIYLTNYHLIFGANRENTKDKSFIFHIKKEVEGPRKRRQCVALDTIPYRRGNINTCAKRR